VESKEREKKDMKVKVTIRDVKEERGIKRVIEGVNMIKVHYMHIWKCHNETPLYN
jgi:hypothetical protein